LIFLFLFILTGKGGFSGKINDKKDHQHHKNNTDDEENNF
jgi:hypothetical protein